MINFDSIFLAKKSHGLNAYASNIDCFTYAEGYFNIAEDACNKIISDRLIGELDIQIFPILYSLRHGIELALKFHLNNLRKCNVNISNKEIYGHNIKKLWDCLKNKTPLDPRFTEKITYLNSTIMRIAELDPDAQIFRYPETTNNQKWPDNKTINFPILKSIIVELSSNLKCFMNESECFIKERKTGTYTNELTRYQLSELANSLPSIESWKNDKNDCFCNIKAEFINKYGISNRAFSGAVDLIKTHREFAGRIGIESNVTIFSSEIIIDIINAHKKNNQPTNSNNGLVNKSEIDLDIKFSSYNYYKTIKDNITIADVIKMETIFYMALKNIYSEFFDNCLQNKTKQNERN
ncbi:hypothetical protein [Arsenophonus endosymbiont of Crataerina pallida]|uniref:hypothetical protein n=1 Tax=Arsenophonus endosymbiont of Crataerina pallida TaxID=3066235 RepID=UPI0030D253AE